MHLHPNISVQWTHTLEVAEAAAQGAAMIEKVQLHSCLSLIIDASSVCQSEIHSATRLHQTIDPNPSKVSGASISLLPFGMSFSLSASLGVRWSYPW